MKYKISINENQKFYFYLWIKNNWKKFVKIKIKLKVTND